MIIFAKTIDMKKYYFLLILSFLCLFGKLYSQPPKKRIPVDKTVKIPLIYKDNKGVMASKTPNNNTIRILVDTTKNKRDTVFVQQF